MDTIELISNEVGFDLENMSEFGAAIRRMVRRRYLPLPENQAVDAAVLEPKVRRICTLAYQAALGAGGCLAARLCERSARDAFILFAPGRYAEDCPKISWVGWTVDSGKLVMVDSVLTLNQLLSLDVVRCRLSLNGFIAIKASRGRMRQRLGAIGVPMRVAD